ncbi:hypothetical protein Q8A67_022120 [Cirrhinus molitorella]|uniref:Vitelline membrane outer layer 1-like protein n=1 Tax=Cirrhinus molitorella TaxID=172907 RepID=A0AA88TD71_9TELE|nr:hypothetical protein Q8A67_022120 [Cirrhinus molitorella]
MHNFTPMMFSLLVIIGLQVSVQAGERRPERTINRIYKWEMTVTNGGGLGKWGRRQMCPSGTYAAGFSLRVDNGQNDDQTGLNGIQLHCVYPYTGASSYYDYSSVQSDVGSWGQWTEIKWCPSGVLIDFRLRVEKYKGYDGDDTSVNNIEFQCSDSSFLVGEGTYRGDWGTWSRICREKGICGIKTLVVEPQGTGDDIALNNVIMYCCK